MDDDLPPQRPTCRDDFEIAILCALPLEYDAVIAVLDGRWNDHGDPFGKVAGDQNTYTTGWIGHHNVVLALLSDMGKINATSVATSFGLSFTKLKIAFLVGICGAVPKTNDGVEIVLGDAIISQQVVEYDFGRRYSDGLKLKNKLAGSFGQQQSHTTRRYINIMQTDHYRGFAPKRTLEYLKAAQEKYPRKYEPLQPIQDKLFSSTYRHKNQARAGCDICDRCKTPSDPVCDTALKSTCEKLECDESQVVHRNRLVDSDAQGTPVVHWGVMGSADTVMKCAINRDQIAEKYNIIGFEMEGAGVCDSFPCIIVKGACDYADGHKSKKWQNYAAITAACVMKVLLQWYPRTDQRSRSVLFTSGQDLLAVNTVTKLQQENENLHTELRQLQALLQQQRDLPPQVPSRDIVCVNDALGETYSFPLTFVDSLEFFMTILKHKFKDVGVAKIERGEWLLQNRRTGHVLDLNRPWKAVVKPGQILDMSMIFKKRNIPSAQCPWCKTENFSDPQAKFIECIQCSGKYRHTEEIYDIVGEPYAGSHQKDTTNKVSPLCSTQIMSERPTSHSPEKQQSDKDEEDIHLYTRVNMVSIDFQIERSADGNNKNKKRKIIIGPQDLEHIARFARKLTKVHHFPEEDCLDALRDYYRSTLGLTVKHSKSHVAEDSHAGLTALLNEGESSRDAGSLDVSPKEGMIPIVQEQDRRIAPVKSKKSQPRTRSKKGSKLKNTSRKQESRSSQVLPVQMWICHECGECWTVQLNTGQCYLCGHHRCSLCRHVWG